MMRASLDVHRRGCSPVCEVFGVCCRQPDLGRLRVAGTIFSVAAQAKMVPGF